MHRISGIGLGLALTLAACGGGGTPTTTLDKVEVTGPASNALKIGEAAQFTATAKTAGGTAVSGKTFTWTSSDNNIASVDGGGKVTAKRFGTVTISAAVDGKTGTSGAQTTYGLEAVGGTTFRAWNPGYVTVALLVRFRPQGSTQPVPDNTPVSVNVSGPSGWINNTPQKAQYGFFANNPIWWDFGDGVAVPGTYTASATFGSESYSTTFTVDTGKTGTPVTGLSLSAASTSSVTGSWTAAPGAARYRMTVSNKVSGNAILNSDGLIAALTDQTQATFDKLNLQTNTAYYLTGQAANFNWRNTDMSVPAPASFNLSRARLDFTLPEMVGGVRLGGSGDTVFTYRYAKPDGSPANANASFKLTGPAGWNGGQPFTYNNAYLGTTAGWFQPVWFGPAIPPLSGTYSYSVVMNGTTYSGSFSLDPSKSLPDPSGLNVTSASPSSVSCSWPAVPGAQSYAFEVWNDTDKRGEGTVQFVKTSSATANGLALEAAKSYFCQIHAFSADLTAPLTTPIANQNNLSFRRTAITLP